MKIENQETTKVVGEITEQQIKAWKAQWGKVFKTTVDNEVYIWRKLKRKEYVGIMSKTSEETDPAKKMYYRQDEIAKATVLYPVNIVELLDSNAGLSPTISDEVVLKSGFDIASTEEL